MGRRWAGKTEKLFNLLRNFIFWRWRARSSSERGISTCKLLCLLLFAWNAGKSAHQLA